MIGLCKDLCVAENPPVAGETVVRGLCLRGEGGMMGVFLIEGMDSDAAESGAGCAEKEEYRVSL